MKKTYKVLSTAALAGVVAAVSFGTDASAAVDSYVVKDADGNLFEYNKAELEASYMASLGLTDGDASLYNSFTAKAVGFAAFHDDTAGYVNFSDIVNAYVEDTANFNLNEYTESATASTTVDASSVTVVSVVDGEVVETSGAVDAEVSEVSVVDVNSIKVSLSAAVENTEDVVVSLKKGAANYNVTTEWNEAKDAVVITSVLNKLNPADYTVVVSGLGEEASSHDVTVKAETVAGVEVVSEKVDIASNATVYLNVLNQYGTRYTTANSSDLTVSLSEDIADVTFSTPSLSASSKKGYDLQGTFSITDAKNVLAAGDTFKVTAVYKGFTDQATVTFADPVAFNEIVFGEVSPLKDKTRITVGETGLEVAYTAFDQYGGEYTLTTADLAKFTFASSDNAIVDPSTIKVVDKKLVLNAGSKAGTATITAIKGDTVSQFTVTVEDVAKVKSVTLNPPTDLVADGEKVSLDLVAYDQFGEVIANDKLTGVTYTTGFAINADTGKLEGTVTQNSAFKVAVIQGGKDLASVTFSVEAAAVANTISAVDFDSVYEIGAEKEITLKNVTVLDQYGRTFKASTISLTAVDGTNDKFSEAGNKVTAAKEGTETFTVKVDGSASAVKNITLTAIASKDIKSYDLEDIGSIYTDPSDTGNYDATPKLSGFTADGTAVVLKTGKIASLTSSDTSVAAVNGTTVYGTLATSKASGTATIKAWATDGSLLGTSVVTVLTAAPELSTIAAATTLGADLASIFTAKDQYGVAFEEKGTWYITDSTGSVVATGAAGNLTFAADADALTVAAGTYTAKFVSTDGETVASTEITVK